MLNLEGIPLSPGYGCGVAVIYDLEIGRRIDLPQSLRPTVLASEYNRLDAALEQSTDDLRLLQTAASSESRFAESVELISARSAMARDIAALVKQHTGDELAGVEPALDAVVAEFVARFARTESASSGECDQDVRDVNQRMMPYLAGSSPWTENSLSPGSVIIARELFPSEVADLAKSGVVAIVTESGGQFSQTAMLARSLGIPAITGIAHVTSLIKPGMQLLVDGEAGRVIESTPSDVDDFATRKRAYQDRISSSETDEDSPCVTVDGIEITLLGNICLPAEIAAVMAHNLAGVGLYRTEFLFLESYQRPSFERQVQVYREMAQGLGDYPLVIRTFDHGGDKPPPYPLSEASRTPAHLRYRGLRSSLAEREPFAMQLRAILQVAQTSDIRILLPMVVGSDDFATAIAAVESAADELGALRRPPSEP